MSKRKFVEQCCIDWQRDLKAYLLGILRDRHLIDDAYQRTVLQALRSADQVAPGKVRGWIFTIALNEARQLRRRKGISLTVVEDIQKLSDEWQKLSTREVSEIVSEEFRDHLETAIERLPTGQMQVIKLRLLDGQSFAAISEQLQRPLGTVLTWMNRALQRLRNDPTLKAHWFDMTQQEH